MNVKPAGEADLERLRAVWEEFEDELGGPEFVRESWEDERPSLERHLRDGVVLLAEEEDGELAGYAEVHFEQAQLAWLKAIYVRPAYRRQGLARTLLAGIASECEARDSRHLGLEVLTQNRHARAFYERLGFSEFGVQLAAGVEELQERLGEREAAPSSGLVFVQTDDAVAIERAAAQFIPRLGHSEQTIVHPPVNGWICVEDSLCSSDPKLLRRLAQELSYRTGGVVLSLGVEEGALVRYVLFERGSVADEYASVPEYFGPLPPGDVVALSANPTVVSRLTGADAARVRAVARTAPSPSELPAPEQLVTELREVLGLGSTS